MIQFININIAPDELSTSSGKRLLRLKIDVETESRKATTATIVDFPYFESVFEMLMRKATEEIKQHFTR